MSHPEELAQTYLSEEDRKMSILKENVEEKGESEGLVYECSCGKQYKSFPAIYLHFRTKHDIKLSTKESESRKKVVESQNSKKYVYAVETESDLAGLQNQDRVNSDIKSASLG